MEFDISTKLTPQLDISVILTPQVSTIICHQMKKLIKKRKKKEIQTNMEELD